jgi:hypothetical protein
LKAFALNTSPVRYVGLLLLHFLDSIDLRQQFVVSEKDWLGNVSALAFSPDGNELISGFEGNVYGNGYLSFRDVAQSCNIKDVKKIESNPTHLVYSTDSQYLAIATTKNQVHIWRVLYNGKFEPYALLSDKMRHIVKSIRFTTTSASASAAAASGEERVILLTVYDNGIQTNLHTYDIRAQLEVREPVTVLPPHYRTSDLLVDSNGCMKCVISGTCGKSLVFVRKPLHYKSATTGALSETLYYTRQTGAAEKFFNQYPALAFQRLMFPPFTLIEGALKSSNDTRFKDLVQLLGPDDAVLDGEPLIHVTPKCALCSTISK